MPDAPTIATDASCFTCQGEKTLLGMAVYLLAQQLQSIDPMADISAPAIAAASNCYTCYMSGKGLLGAMVYLLANGSGGGPPVAATNPVYTGVAPPAAPAFPLQGALYVPDNDALPFQVWIPGIGWTVR